MSQGDYIEVTCIKVRETEIMTYVRVADISLKGNKDAGSFLEHCH